MRGEVQGRWREEVETRRRQTSQFELNVSNQHGVGDGDVMGGTSFNDGGINFVVGDNNNNAGGWRGIEITAPQIEDNNGRTLSPSSTTRTNGGGGGIGSLIESDAWFPSSASEPQLVGLGEGMALAGGHDDSMDTDESLFTGGGGRGSGGGEGRDRSISEASSGGYGQGSMSTSLTVMEILSSSRKGLDLVLDENEREGVKDGRKMTEGYLRKEGDLRTEREVRDEEEDEGIFEAFTLDLDD
ncbi:hypothetical protein TrCOL_g2507 [Triparma columacea]|uniref:Uncharacterized protein n=1 Tax=Triparma columacea TaxID=722753 RepID=A0A9W7GHY2_9STRA|nr:hypothetical protein TrCOL_g2507 [Triparma columacea]